jgi:hypothetical protein
MTLNYEWVLKAASSTFLTIATKPGGRDLQVTSENVAEYVQEVLDAIIGKGAELQAKAFREGFSKVFPICDLQAFSADELVMLFGNSDEDWSIESKNCSLILWWWTYYCHSVERSTESWSWFQCWEPCNTWSSRNHVRVRCTYTTRIPSIHHG